MTPAGAIADRGPPQPFATSSTWLRRYRRFQPWLYVGPALAITLVLVATPVIYLIQASFKRMELGDPIGSAPFVGLDNYRAALDGPSSLSHALWLSLIYTVSALVIELALGLGIALLIERLEAALPVLLAVLLVPMVLMPAMVAMVWRLYFTFDGLVNWSIGLLGIGPVNWFSADHALKAVIITDVWQWTPFFVLLFVAGLQNVPRELKEAAQVDGVSSWQMVWRIKLPLLLPLVIIASTLRVMELLRQFDLAFVMFGGGPANATEILPLAIFRTTVQRLDLGVGSVLSLGLIVIVMAVCWVFIALMRRYRVDAA
jgi:multiple sugar transport system permease protein